MKVTLIYPPDHRIPHSLYLSLPELAALLKEEGHEVTIRDLNAEVLNILLNNDLLGSYKDYMECTLKVFKYKGALPEESRIEQNLINAAMSQPLDLALRGGDAAEVFYDRDRFYNPKEYRLALDRLETSLEFIFSPIVGLSPYSPRYLWNMEQILSNLQNDPVIQVLRSGLITSILDQAPDLIGITMPYQENIMEGFRLASLLKIEDPQVPIVIGGPQVTKYREQIFQDNTLFDFINYGVVYEGGRALVELVEALNGKRSFDSVRNLYWEDRGRIRFNGISEPEDMNKLPTPCYDSADLGLYLKPEPVFGLMTSRGCCWKKCVFCSEAFHSRFSMRKSKLVFEDIKTLVEKYDAKHFYFWDSLMPPRTMREVSEMIVAEGLDIRWFADSKFYDNFARPEYLSLLQKAGLKCIQFGLESANQRMLDLMRKGTKISKVPEILRSLHDHNIMSQISWFTGFPTETSEEFKETVRFFEENRKYIDLNVFVGSFYFEFGTYLSRHPEEFDSQIVDISGDFQLNCASGMDKAEVAKHKKRYLETSDMDLLCHGGYFLYHSEKGISPHEISRSKGRSFLDD